jgi:hypothetical protein
LGPIVGVGLLLAAATGIDQSAGKQQSQTPNGIHSLHDVVMLLLDRN